LAHSLWESGKYGILGVIQQLRRRGLPDAIIREAMSSFEREQELLYAIALLERRKLEPEERNKAGRFLAARGFSYTVIEQALEHFVYLR
jgi:SOS response regulatory protein OraA/RecX